MRIWIGLLAACAGSLWAAEIAAPWSDGFESGDLRHYSRWNTGGVSIEKQDGGSVLVLGKQPENAKSKQTDIILKEVPVEDSVKYRLSFRAKVDGPDTFENNPQLEYLFYEYGKKSQGKPLPGWKIIFYGKNKKYISRGFPMFWNVFLHKGWTSYAEVFFPPAGAVAMGIIFSNNANPDNRVLIDDLKLESAEEGTLNVNPEFKYGEYNFSGCNYVKNAKIIEYDKGKFALDTRKGWCIMDPFPVTPGKEYELSAAIQSSETPGRLSVWCCDGDLKKVSQLKQVLSVIPPNEETKTIRFVVPEGVSYLRLVTGNGGVFKSIRVNQIQK